MKSLLNSLTLKNLAEQPTANNAHHIVIQGLYQKLVAKGHIDAIKIFEWHEPPETLAEDNKLILRKVEALTEAL